MAYDGEHCVCQNFFVVQLKGIEAGERPADLYGYPSLVPLQTWIERTFRSDKYRVRYDRLTQTLTDDWQQRCQVWKQKLDDLYQDAARREQICKNLRRYIQDLQTITDIHLGDITTFQQNFSNQGRQVTTMMRQRGEKPKGIRNSEELLPWRDTLVAEYSELNDLLDNGARLQSVDAWIREVKAKARALPVQMPVLVAPDPAAQQYPWNNQRFLSSEVYAEFSTVMEKWPRGFWERVVLGFFNDSRTPLVKDLQDFWYEQYADIWSRRLDAYLQTCTTFIKQQQAIQTIVQTELAEQERLNDPEVRKRREQEIMQVIKAFQEHDQERKQLQSELHQALLSA